MGHWQWEKKISILSSPVYSGEESFKEEEEERLTEELQPLRKSKPLICLEWVRIIITPGSKIEREAQETQESQE